MREDNVERLIAYSKKKNVFRSRIAKPEKTHIPREEMVQKYLLSILFQHESPKKIAAQIFSAVNKEDFSIPSYQKIITLYREFLDSSGELDSYTAFSETLPSEIKAVADEIYLYASGEHTFDKEKIWEVVYELLEHSYRMKYSSSEKEDEVMAYKKKLDALNKKELENLFKSV
jgi:hypothetical protein